ncbi:N,N-dimethylformamidase beta subunit family domain-containing protein [Mycolicibacterium fluoranthenivorans]|uniref:N,N-dimethylformamidase beta subunit family domain-containing protein n=1 Tax=Mycolicibacterium fluoranthenivorans TaxID=258505 RepID=UPI002E2C7C41|nr:N,N-dimethylformamidase beta subunit family domain-containing protein [Mycolicibacterium fluoranthenivorans]
MPPTTVLPLRGISDGPQWPHWYQWIRGERPAPSRSPLEIWGYVGHPSYGPGDDLTLHVSTTADAFDVVIYRDGGERSVVYQRAQLPGAMHPTPVDAFASGCRWPVAHTFTVPEDWRSGGYVVEFTASDHRGTATQEGFFVLRAGEDRRAAIAFVVATYTWQAYNDWGGGCAYSLDPTSTDLAAGEVPGFSPRLAFDRPWGRGLIRLPVGAPRIALPAAPATGWAPRREQGEWAIANGYSYWSGSAGWAGFDALFARWAERNGYAIDYISQWDLDRDDACLDGYRCVVTVGHDEYWTARGRDVLDRFIEDGGRYARFAGNILWQIRLENSDVQVCFKYAPDADPLARSPDANMRTGAFEGRNIANPPVTTFGANGGRGTYSRMGGASPRGVGGFIVYRNDHWVFSGTDLYYADVLGATVPLVGYEADGVDYTFRRGLPEPTGEDGAPDNLQILALTPGRMAEEDHRQPGAFLEIGDNDLRMVASALYGSDSPENLVALGGGAAVITSMQKGRGEVLCGGSTEWPYGLSQREPMVERVVANVLDRFSAPT